MSMLEIERDRVECWCVERALSNRFTRSHTLVGTHHCEYSLQTRRRAHSLECTDMFLRSLTLITAQVLPQLAEIESLVVATLSSALPDANVEGLPALTILPTQTPPAFFSRASVLYVLRSPLGHIYVGETDGLHERLATHRGKAMWKSADAFTVSLPGRSHARKAEASVIKAMHERNWPITNRHDSTHVHFGAANDISDGSAR